MTIQSATPVYFPRPARSVLARVDLEPQMLLEVIGGLSGMKTVERGAERYQWSYRREVGIFASQSEEGCERWRWDGWAVAGLGRTDICFLGRRFCRLAYII